MCHENSRNLPRSIASMRVRECRPALTLLAWIGYNQSAFMTLATCACCCCQPKTASAPARRGVVLV